MSRLVAPPGLDERLVSLVAPSAFEAEPYRSLRYAIESRGSAHAGVIAVSSAEVGDGKTTTAINLAGALAQAPDASVLLIDADLRRPAVADRLGIRTEGARGLVDAVLDPRVALDDVAQAGPTANLMVVPAGRTAEIVYEIFSAERFRELVAAARGRYRHVIVDAPPLLPIADCRLIEPAVDGLLIVVAAHRTPRPLLEEALAVVDARRVLGLVFNRDDRPLGNYYAGYGYTSRRAHLAPTDWLRRAWRRLAAGGGGTGA